MNAWFEPPGNNFTYRSWAGSSWGALVPGFRNPQNLPGCGVPCREVPRRDGQALRDALAAGMTTGAKLSLLEGWTDIFESAGYYRSATWRFPNQYIGIVRDYADPGVKTLRLQAEGADRFSPGAGGADAGAGSAIYRAGVSNIGKLADATGWYVDWTRAAGWLEYQEINLPCGTYRFTVRASATATNALHLEVDGAAAASVAIARSPAVGGDGGAPAADFAFVHLATINLAAGAHTLRLAADSAGAAVDWFFLRRSAECH